MNKMHGFLLIVTLILAGLSGYSLAAMNHVYKVDFEWYSEYNKSFTDQVRVAPDEKWSLNKYPEKMEIEIYNNENSSIIEKTENPSLALCRKQVNFQKDILIYCTLGIANSPEYRVRVTDIAQRGNVVEIKMSFNSPLTIEDTNSSYLPFEIIKIKKDAFLIKGNLYFIFKNQAGTKIGERRCII